ncbi:MAG: Cof-type HAD-IIB family hydrolase [Lachnospiraceae bacterium]|nr:Cof-type HAD-IIB family hydrolase [Lachnospiraceae bacterium]
MIKLIVSDIDGTMLQNGAQSISRKTINLIERLCDRGVIFAAASGREYSNLYRLFGRVQDRIMYICLNGAMIMHRGKLICKTPIDRETGLEIIADIQAKRGCDVLVSGLDCCYIKQNNREYVNHIVNVLKNRTTFVHNFEDIEEEFLKISAHAAGGIDQYSDDFIAKWGLRLPTAVSGDDWIDFNGPLVNKGNALMVVQRLFDIREDETMTFGDNYNDVEMFDKSYFSYAMSGSTPDIRARARYLTPTVESILFDVLHMR